MGGWRACGGRGHQNPATVFINSCPANTLQPIACETHTLTHCLRRQWRQQNPLTEQTVRSGRRLIADFKMTFFPLVYFFVACCCRESPRRVPLGRRGNNQKKPKRVAGGKRPVSAAAAAAAVVGLRLINSASHQTKSGARDEHDSGPDSGPNLTS